MQLGRVIGNVVCTIKSPALVGQRLLIVQPIDGNGREVGLCADCSGFSGFGRW